MAEHKYKSKPKPKLKPAPKPKGKPKAKSKATPKADPKADPKLKLPVLRLSLRNRPSSSTSNRVSLIPGIASTASI